MNNKFYTNKTKAKISWPTFDITDVVEMYVYVNGDSQRVDPSAKRFDVTLSEGDNQITAKALFANGVWSPHSNRLNLFKDATPPSPVLNLTVQNDSSFTGNISLNWSASQDLLPVVYLVFRKEKSAVNYKPIDTTRATHFFDPYRQADGTVLKAFQDYEYKILPQDTLGNSAEQNAGMGSTYCNIAPTIQKFSFSMDTLSVFWQFPDTSAALDPVRSAVPLDSVRFDVKLFKDRLPQDFSDAPPYRVDYVVGKTHFKFSVEAGPKYYAVVQAVNLLSANLDKSAWSLPRFSDTGLSIIPAVDSLLTQAQPLDTTGIFVSWERYWHDPFWTVNGKEMVGKVRVIRWKVNEPQTKTEREFLPSSPEFIQSGWMDREQLEDNAKYVYQVIPFEIKVNDPPRLLPAGNNEAYSLNDTSVVINYIDRVFIPKLNHLFAKNPATGKKYFSYPDPTDSLRLEWFWLYKKNDRETPAVKGDFRGAERIKLFVANNSGFENLPNYKKFSQIVEINRKDLADDSLFYFSYVSDLTNQRTFNLYEGKSLFLKIMGFDQWGHDPSYPSSASAELDGITEMVLDNTPPPDPGLSFFVKSSTDTTAGVSLVDIHFNWSPVVDNISGLRKYSILVTQKDHPDSVVLEIGNISPNDITFTEVNFEIKDEYFEHPLLFKILPKDYAGNVNLDTKPVEFSFFNPPIITAIKRDTVTNNLAIKWTKVTSADKYLFVFANQKSYFLDEQLRDNPGNREEVVAVATDPDTIIKTLNK
ncbi:MAG TPA: hypothetical protein ENH29_10800 [Bacteroidetes bacterium]|nr:hypothetical protein [Bacteroidota bacterium]